MEATDDKDWCPTMNGNVVAYEAQCRTCLYLNGELCFSKWEPIPVISGHGLPNGVPYPQFRGGVLQAVGLQGREQAMTLAWSAAAGAEANGVLLETRVAVYELHYNIKARVLEGKEIACATHHTRNDPERK